MSILTELFRSFLPSHEAYMFMWLLACLGVTAFATAFERWTHINKRTDYNAARLFNQLKKLIEDKRIDDAYRICVSGGRRALPRILAAGIQKAQVEPQLVAGAMAEESTHMATTMEKRMNFLVMFSNVSTLLGLLGTVFGLIMSFSAVSKPDVAAVEKSALLAAGISTAMNSTLVGLTISVICVMIYAFLRAKVDAALSEIDRYAVAIVNLLNPPDVTQKKLSSLGGRREDDKEIADTDVTPMLNLMIILIPVLLTSSEFVKVGAIELKLPEAAQGAGTGAGGGAAGQQQEVKLDLGVAITAKGFSLFHYFKSEGAAQGAQVGAADMNLPDIPLVNGQYDIAALGQKLADIKKRALLEVCKSNGLAVGPDMSLYQLYKAYVSSNLNSPRIFADHESIKIVGEDKIKYETVVAVMDAARGTRTPEGSVTMFPNVSIAGGIVQ